MPVDIAMRSRTGPATEILDLVIRLQLQRWLVRCGESVKYVQHQGNVRECQTFLVSDVPVSRISRGASGWSAAGAKRCRARTGHVEVPFAGTVMGCGVPCCPFFNAKVDGALCGVQNQVLAAQPRPLVTNMTPCYAGRYKTPEYRQPRRIVGPMLRRACC